MMRGCAVTRPTQSGINFGIAQMNAATSPIALASQAENKKLTKLVGDQKDEIDKIIERLCGPASSYTALKRAREAMPQTTPAILATAAGLSLISSLVASTTCVDIGRGPLHPSVMIACPAVSGAGKDAPINFVPSCLRSVGLSEMIATDLTSHAAVDAHLINCNVLQHSFDESGAKAAASSGTTLESMQTGVLNRYVELYTKTNEGTQTTSYAASANRPVFMINRPVTNVLMTSTPTLLFQQIGGGMLGGLGNRFLLLPCVDSEPPYNPKVGQLRDFPALKKSLTEELIGGIAGKGGSGFIGSHLDPALCFRFECMSRGFAQGTQSPTQLRRTLLTLDQSPEIAKVKSEIEQWQGLSGGASQNMVYRRFRENTYRVAILLQRARTLLSEPGNLGIDATDLQNAMELVAASCFLLDASTREFEISDEIREIADALLEPLRVKPMPRSEWMKIKRRAGEKRQRAERLLFSNGEVVQSPGSRGGHVVSLAVEGSLNATTVGHSDNGRTGRVRA
jgi:hypothetical protein